jgi:hypothetical protein
VFPPAVKERNEAFETTVLFVVTFRCDTWSLTLMEEQRMRVFENRVLKGATMNEVTGGWRKLESTFIICTRYQVLLG